MLKKLTWKNDPRTEIRDLFTKITLVEIFLVFYKRHHVKKNAYSMITSF